MQVSHIMHILAYYCISNANVTTFDDVHLSFFTKQINFKCTFFFFFKDKITNKVPSKKDF